MIRSCTRRAGPNTGGMGAYSPAAAMTPAVEASVMKSIVQATASAMVAEGTPFRGVLFAGLMIKDGKVQLSNVSALCCAEDRAVACCAGLTIYQSYGLQNSHWRQCHHSVQTYRSVASISTTWWDPSSGSVVCI